MASLSEVFRVIRVVTLILVILFSEIVLVMGAIMTDSLGGLYPGFILAVAISILTLLSVPVGIFLSSNRRGAFLSMVVVELCCLGVLSVLWLAVAGMMTSIWVKYCEGYSSSRGCRKVQPLAAFSFLNWLLLMGLDIFLLSLVIVQDNRGNSAIWTSFVTEVDYSAPRPASSEPNESPVKLSPTVAQYPQYVPTPPQKDFPQQVYLPQPQQRMPMVAQV